MPNPVWEDSVEDVPSWESSTPDGPSWEDSTPDVDEDLIRRADLSAVTAPSQPFEAPSSLREVASEGWQNANEEFLKTPFGLPKQALNLVPKPSAQTVQDALDSIANPRGLGAPSQAPTPTAKRVAGAINVGRGIAEAFTDPLGMATLGVGALPRVGQKLVSGGFLADMAIHTPEAARQAGEASVTGDEQERMEAYGNLGITPFMASAVGLHAAGRAPVIERPVGMTPEEAAINRAAINRAAPGTVRPAELEVMGTPVIEPPPMFQAGEVPFGRMQRFGGAELPPVEVLPQRGRLADVQILEEPRSLVERETRGKTSFGAEAPALVRNAVEQAEAVGLTKSAEALKVTDKRAVPRENQIAEAAAEPPNPGAQPTVEAVKPGAESSTAPRLVPVVRTDSGRMFGGERHPFAVSEALQKMREGEITAEDLSTMQQGFYDLTTKKYLTREEAGKAMKTGGEITSEQIPEVELKRNAAEFAESNKTNKADVLADSIMRAEVLKTEDARALGEKITTVEDIARLKERYDQGNKDGRDAWASYEKNPTDAQMQAAVNKSNMPSLINEAIEAATGAYDIKRTNPTEYRARMDAGLPAAEFNARAKAESGGTLVEAPATPTTESTTPTKAVETGAADAIRETKRQNNYAKELQQKGSESIAADTILSRLVAMIESKLSPNSDASINLLDTIRKEIYNPESRSPEMRDVETLVNNKEWNNLLLNALGEDVVPILADGQRLLQAKSQKATIDFIEDVGGKIGSGEIAPEIQVSKLTERGVLDEVHDRGISTLKVRGNKEKASIDELRSRISLERAKDKARFESAIKTQLPSSLPSAFIDSNSVNLPEGYKLSKDGTRYELDKSKTFSESAKVVADKLRDQFKTDVTQQQLGTFGIVPKVINAAVEIAAKVIEKGGSAADAIAEAIAYVRKNHGGYFDEAGLTKLLREKAASVKPPEKPSTAGTTEKMRKSAERATTAEMVPEPVQERIADAPESRYTQQSMSRVEDVVAAMPDAELAKVSKDTDIYTAAKLEQARRLFDKGENDSGYNVFVELEKEGTRLGQLINQFKLLKSTTPENVVRVIDQTLTKAGKDRLTKEQKAQATDIATRAKEADTALDAATKEWERTPTPEKAKAAETALDKSNAEAVELQKFVSKFQPRSTSAILKSILQGSLLTPISHPANIFGNMSFLPFRASERSIATGIDMIDATIRDKPREIAVQPLRGTVEALKGFGRGIAKVPSILARGTGDTIKGETRAGLHPMRAWVNQFAKNPEMPTTGGKLTLKDRLNLAIEGTFGVPAEAMLRGLGAGDAPFKEAARARTTAEQLRLAKVPKDQWSFAQKFPELFLTPEQMRLVVEGTNKAVFQGDSPILNKITQAIRSKGEVVDFAVATIAPYKLTPWNIIGEILSYNPLVAMAKTANEARKGNGREAKLSAGKFVVGSLLTASGVWLYQKGLLAPSLDERDEAQKARVLSGKVVPPNHLNLSGLKRALEGGDPSFKAGDETVDVFRAGGLAGSIFYMTANIGRDTERNPKSDDSVNAASILRQSTLEQARFGLNQSFLSGVEGLLTAVKDGNTDNFVRQWINTVSAIPLPNTMATVSRATRDSKPDFSADTFNNKVENTVRNKLGFAGMDDYLPLKRDFWGQPLPETPKGRNALFYQFFDISKNQQVTSDPVELELYRLWRKTGDSKVIPSLAEKSVTLNRETFNLTPEQHSRYAEQVGKRRREIIDQIVVNPEFIKLPDEHKIRILDRAYRAGMERGKGEFGQEFNGKLTPKLNRSGFMP